MLKKYLASGTLNPEYASNVQKERKERKRPREKEKRRRRRRKKKGRKEGKKER